MNKVDWALFVAIVSAFISGGSFFFTLYSSLRKRRRVHVECGIVWMANMGGPNEANPPYHLIYTVTNLDELPVTITGFGGAIKEKPGGFFLKPKWSQIPYKLEPGAEMKEATDELDIVASLKALYAFSTAGVKYKASWKNLRAVKKNVAKLHRGPDGKFREKESSEKDT